MLFIYLYMIFISYLFIFTVLYLDIFRQMYYNFSDNILWMCNFDTEMSLTW